MSYIYEDDVSKVGGNLQKTVGYLLSLHKNGYEWNMLGIKVVGHIDALPIPTGTYEYGDTYMVGTETPYEMYIYTRADSLHTSDYWFNVGKFPQPGEQGPAGPSLIDVDDMYIQGIQNVVYDEEDGAVIDYYNSTLDYIDPNDHNTKQDTIPLVELQLPIKAGKYISMDADEHNMNLEIKVDDTDLAADFYKIDKSSVTQITVPVNNKGTVGKLVATDNRTQNSIVMRDSNGNSQFSIVYAAAIKQVGTSKQCGVDSIYNNLELDIEITKTSSDTGTLSLTNLSLLQSYLRMNVIYDNQVYYRMDPKNAPDGTLNYIHIDATQNGSGGYKATGKAFSITVSTRAWQVVDLDFGGSSGSTEYAFTHHIHLVTTDGKVYAFDLSTHDTSAITFSDLLTNFDGLIIHGVQAPEQASTTLTPAIFKVAGADSEIELVSADMSVLSSIKAENISQEEDYVTESKPN